MLVCQRSKLTNLKKQRQEAEQAVLGGAVANTEKERSKKRRASSSFKCDCEFKLKFKWDPTHNVCTCLQANLIHTNGCSPSMLQNEICKARSGQNILRLSKFLAVTLDCLFRGKAKPCCIRDVIRQHCVLSEETPITPQMLINIKLCLDRMGSKIQQDTEFFMNIDPDRVQVLNTDENAKLDRFAHDWLKAALNSEGGTDIQDMLKQCKLKDPVLNIKFSPTLTIE